MPAYPTHTLFSQMALLALADARHPLAGVAMEHADLFRVAGIAGCDIQCMPYQVCRHCKAPYRHNQKANRKCLVCGKEALEIFILEAADGRRLTRVDVERDYYRNTHLVLGRQNGYGVAANTPAGPPEQPFPKQVVRHLANVLRDAPKIAGPKRQIAQYYAFTLGWFSHVVSDALFKGVYPQSVRVNFFGHQYHMAMLPAAESLTLTDISHDFGVHWPTWHKELLEQKPDGGALRHLTIGSSAGACDPAYWTAEFGKPDSAIGRVMDAVRRINGTWFHRMYLTPDYSSPTPRLDARKLSERADWKFNGNDLGQVRRYAIRSGWYSTFIKGIEIYLRIVDEATRLAGNISTPDELAPRHPGIVDWSLWCSIIEAAISQEEHPSEWGSALQTDAELQRLRGASVRIVLPEAATDYQRRVAEVLRQAWRMQSRRNARLTVFIGPPAFHRQPIAFCREDAIRAKYDAGLAGLVRFDPTAGVLHVMGFSDYGDQRIISWLAERNRS